MMHFRTLLFFLMLIFLLNAYISQAVDEPDLETILAKSEALEQGNGASGNPGSASSANKARSEEKTEGGGSGLRKMKKVVRKRMAPDKDTPVPTQPTQEDDLAREKAEQERNENRKVKKGYKKSIRDWNKVSDRDLEKDWEAGDDPTELEHEYEHSQKTAQKMQSMLDEDAEREMRKQQAKIKGKSKSKSAGAKSKSKGKGASASRTFDEKDETPPIDPSDPESVRASLNAHAKRSILSGGVNHLNANSGTSMFFVDLHLIQPAGCKKPGKPWDKESVDDMAGYWSSMLKTAHLSANVYNLGAHSKDGQMLLAIDKGWQTTDILKFVLKQKAVKKVSKDNRDYTADMFKGSGDDDDEL